MALFFLVNIHPVQNKKKTQKWFWCPRSEKKKKIAEEEEERVGGWSWYTNIDKVWALAAISLHVDRKTPRCGSLPRPFCPKVRRSLFGRSSGSRKSEKEKKKQEQINRLSNVRKCEAQWPIGYGVGLRIKRSSVRIRPWPLRWVLGQGSLLPLSQGEAFTLASISYLAILVKYILQKKKKKKKKKTDHKDWLKRHPQNVFLSFSSWKVLKVFKPNHVTLQRLLFHKR